MIGTLLTVDPTPPNAATAVTAAAGDLSNGLVNGFVSALPYVVPVLVAFTVFGFVRKMINAKKNPG